MLAVVFAQYKFCILVLLLLLLLHPFNGLFSRKKPG